MKIKLSQDQVNEVLKDPKAVIKAGIKVDDPWWVIALKVLAYLIGLLLAGVGTTSCAAMVGLM